MTFIILYGKIRVWKCEKARNAMKGGMNMFNRVEFEVAVLRSGLKKKEVAKLMGINEATLYKKLSGKSDFTQPEMQKVCTILSLDSPTTIFFA